MSIEASPIAQPTPILRRIARDADGSFQIEGGDPLTNLVPTRRSAIPLPVTMYSEAMRDALQTAGITHDGDPSKLFAEVYKDGKMVARLYNGGSAETHGAASAVISGVDEPYESGPELARWRAEKIAAELGGVVKMAPTAQTPSQWRVSHDAEVAQRDAIMAPYKAARDAWSAWADPLAQAQTAPMSKTV